MHVVTHNICFNGEISKNIPKWATSWENLFSPYANNKGADQPAHPLASPCSWAGQFVSYLVANPEVRFSRHKAQIIIKYLNYLFLREAEAFQTVLTI